jgi:gliding motility-associated protein GldM
MGHGKETPRQKMIGMMYLVLTALLALNVSKDVLNAFILVDQGLTKTIHNFEEKNEVVYNEFREQFELNQAKVGKFYQEVQKIKQEAQNIYDFIQEKKIEIVKTAEGDDTEAVLDGEIHWDFIQAKDNTSVPAQVMVGDNNDKAAKELRKKIEEFKEYLLSLVDESNIGLKEALESGLDTHDHPPKDGKPGHIWESAHFEHLPMAGVLTNMTAIQASIRNAEADMINYLYSQIDAGSFKFNKLEPIIIPNSNYILKGNMYEAEVFLAAFDTTQKPIVLQGKTESYVDETGTTKYRMVGSVDTLEVKESGKAVFRRPGNALGSYDWGGIIRLQHHDGTFIEKIFKTEYQVAEGSVVVAPTKMNVFYMGVDNPVEISVSGVPDHKIRASVTNGFISERPPYIVRPRRIGNCILTVSAEIDGAWKELQNKDFRVKKVPDPVAKVAQIKTGAIAKNLLLAQSGVQADMEAFDFEMEFKVTEFVVTATIKGFARSVPTNGNNFTQEQKDLIQSLGRNDKVYIEGIKAIGPDGIPRELSTITLIIN